MALKQVAGWHRSTMATAIVAGMTLTLVAQVPTQVPAGQATPPAGQAGAAGQAPPDGRGGAGAPGAQGRGGGGRGGPGIPGGPNMSDPAYANADFTKRDNSAAE